MEETWRSTSCKIFDAGIRRRDNPVSQNPLPGIAVWNVLCPITTITSQNFNHRNHRNHRWQKMSFALRNVSQDWLRKWYLNNRSNNGATSNEIRGSKDLRVQPSSQGLSSYRPVERAKRGAVRWETLGTRLLRVLHVNRWVSGEFPSVTKQICFASQGLLKVKPEIR